MRRCYRLRSAASRSRFWWPSRRGGGNNVFARQMAKSLGELHGLGIVVENKPGAGGNPGTEQVVRSAPGGSTLLAVRPFAEPLRPVISRARAVCRVAFLADSRSIGCKKAPCSPSRSGRHRPQRVCQGSPGHSGTVLIKPARYKQLKYHPQKVLLPVTRFASSALVLVVSAASPVTTLAGLIALARARRGALNFGSSGGASGAHLTGEMFAQSSGLKMIHIQYQGTALALTDLAGGQVQFMFSVIAPTPTPALALVKSIRLRAIAVTSLRNAPAMPDVPTLAESGLPGFAGFESALTYGLLAPANTPVGLVAALSAQLLQVAATAEFQSWLQVEGAVRHLGGPSGYAAVIRAESAKWADVVKTSGATAD
ncbi:MAG: tripartite tricarboxylate transporter substrate binding protein [Polaromonas sp.]|nr:tripartite tricarboxylate transporter substrate binding protein [Polaromonas sp.]